MLRKPRAQGEIDCLKIDSDQKAWELLTPTTVLACIKGAYLIDSCNWGGSDPGETASSMTYETKFFDRQLESGWVR